MNLRYKYRIYPTKIQEQLMISVGGTTRFLYNYFLKQNIDQYKIDNIFTLIDLSQDEFNYFKIN